MLLGGFGCIPSGVVDIFTSIPSGSIHRYYYIYTAITIQSMEDNVLSNAISEAICRTVDRSSFLDSNKIVWKVVDDEWIGKRSVWTFDFKACWLDDTTKDNVKSWWCGRNSNYEEVFKQWN